MSNIKKLVILAFVLFPGAVLADSGPSTKPVKTDTVFAVEAASQQLEKLDLESMLTLAFAEPVKKEKPVAPAPSAEPVVYEVKEGDTLYTIAENYKVAWTRVYDANTQIENPELIQPGDKLKIPKPDESIEPRALPVAPAPVEQPTSQPSAPVPTQSAPVVAGLLAGSYGYSLAGGNCVDMAKRYGKNQPGNPVSWVPTTRTPFIGAAALFYYNHVAIVSGIHYDGSIEVIHENCPNCPTRYPASTFRGFF